MSINPGQEQKRSESLQDTPVADIQEQIINANRLYLVGTLTSGVVHDINNANFILLNTQIISAAWEDALKILDAYHAENGDFMLGGLPYSEMKENMPKLSGGIVDASRRIRDIVDNLKAMVKHEMPSATVHFDINQAVRTAVNMMNHQIRKNTDSFSAEYDGNIPRMPLAPGRIVQAVSNLLLNAIHSAGKSRAAVSVATRFDVERWDVVIEVRDEGAGIDRCVLDHIGDPLVTTKDNPCLGLNLFVVNAIAAEHGGSFKMDSEVGRGTTAQIRLPATKQDAC